MARIQILRLPARKVDGPQPNPFALIVDQLNEDGEVSAGFEAFAAQCGAVSTLVVPFQLDVVPDVER